MKKVQEKIRVPEKTNNNILFDSILKFTKLRTASLKELLDIALLEVLKITHSKFGYVQLFENGSQKFRKEYDIQDFKSYFNPQRTRFKYDDTVSNKWKEAIKTRSPVINNSISDDLKFQKENGNLPIPIRKLLTVPVISDNKIVAMVEVCNKNTDYTNQDIEVLNLLMGVVILTVERFELVNKLKWANKKAVEGERLRSAFMNNISHEIRTPMNAIMGFSKLLMRSKLNEQKKNKYLSIIVNSSNQLLSIVTDILTISSIDSKHESLHLSEVNINKLLSETEMIFSNNNINDALEISAIDELENIDPNVITDKTKITQILNNLINNAVKFTQEGKITFGCTYKNDELNFFVKDTGVGIPKSQFEKIFNRFYQVDQKSGNQYGGTGLGLAICKEFTKILHGKIWLESEIKKGTTFYFSVPYIPATRKAVSYPENNHLDLGLTILVAEDEYSNFKLIQEHLISANCKIIYAYDGKQAIEEYKANPDIDLILMDIKMPVMDGHIAARRIKKTNPNIPVIAQTAYALPTEIKKYGALFDDYITKPIEFDILIKTIAKYSKKLP